MKDDAAGFTGSIPVHYDQGLGPVIFVDYATEMAHRVAACTPARVLETAAGSGIVTRQLRDVLPNGTHLTATDLNAPMLDVARTKFQPGEQVEFKPADAMALPFEDGSYDAVVCQFGVMFFPDKAKSYHEVYRVLAPGGRYFLSVWDSHHYNPWARIVHEVGGQFFPEDPPQFYTVPFSYHQVDAIERSLAEAGFTDIEVAVTPIEKDIVDIAAFARGTVYGNPLIDQIRVRGGVEPERIVDAILQEFRSRFCAQPSRMPIQAIMLSARKAA